jgi:hypothetical protein
MVYASCYITTERPVVRTYLEVSHVSDAFMMSDPVDIMSDYNIGMGAMEAAS